MPLEAPSVHPALQAEETTSGWRVRPSGPRLYRHYGCGLVQPFAHAAVRGQHGGEPGQHAWLRPAGLARQTALRPHQFLPAAHPLRPAGPSGAGKSTLLNALACRLDKGATMEGKARLNGQSYSLAHLKRMASYVMQVRGSCRRAQALAPPARAACSQAPLMHA